MSPPFENKLMFVIIGGYKFYYVITEYGIKDSDIKGTVKNTYSRFPRHCQLLAVNSETEDWEKK